MNDDVRQAKITRADIGNPRAGDQLPMAFRGELIAADPDMDNAYEAGRLTLPGPLDRSSMTHRHSAWRRTPRAGRGR
jgi:hypothetical protein